MRGHKLHGGTSKTKQLVPVHFDLPLFWKPHCAACAPAGVILVHVTGSCKGPIPYPRNRCTLLYDFSVFELTIWWVHSVWCLLFHKGLHLKQIRAFFFLILLCYRRASKSKCKSDKADGLVMHEVSWSETTLHCRIFLNLFTYIFKSASSVWISISFWLQNCL